MGPQTSGTVPVLAPSSSPQSLAIIRRWLDKCLSEHTNCQNGNSALPSRLLDVGPADGSKEPRIVCQSNIGDQKARYLALSYCWGRTTKQSPWTLRTTNIDRLSRGVPSNQLPQTFQDVIKIMRALKERFVWIDALCIIQDSPDDWAQEAASMARVYQNALVTLISPAPDPEESLFSARNEFLTQPACLRLNSFSRTAVVRFHPVLPHWSYSSVPGTGWQEEPGLEAKLPTRKRAWCLQEYELSCRTIMFTTHQFAWVCRQM
ncbi:heterokaryon incompatibility protein-domain-containing protein, partial [Lasiosphaeria hispida]